MSYNLKMFDSKVNVVAVKSGGYDSIVQHSHEFVELVYVVGGEAENDIGSKHIRLKEGDIFVIADRNVMHSIRPIGEAESFSIINIIFPHDFYQFDYKLLSPDTVYTKEQIPDGKELIYKIVEEYENKRWQYEDMTYSLTKILLTKIFRILPTRKAKRVDGATAKKQIDTYIETAENYIKQNFDKTIKVDDVAKACGLNTQYLQRLFKRERDTSIISFVVKYRIEQACRYLLNTDYPVSTIAELVGFDDLKYFHVKFKDVVNETPSQYKIKHKEEK